jgi:hypothetical protein
MSIDYSVEKYSKLTNDRSGAQIQDILLCRCFCKKNNIHYFGACGKIHKRDTTNYQQMKALEQTSKLCTFLKIPIPIIDNNIFNTKTFDDNQYLNVNPNITLTPEICNELRVEMNSNCYSIKENDEFIVVVHIRRGDVDTDGRWKFRYTGNDYYVSIIEFILKHKPDAKVYIFSQSNSDESFDVFQQMGCILKLDGELVEAWNYMIQADIFVMASSSFSIVPAIFNNTGIIIYKQNKYFTPLNHWISYDDMNAKFRKIEKLLRDRSVH